MPNPLDPAVLLAALAGAGFRPAARPLTPGPGRRLTVPAAASPTTRSVLVVTHPGGGRTFHLPAGPPPATFAAPIPPTTIEFVLPAGVTMPVADLTGDPAADAPAATVLDVELDTELDTGQFAGDPVAAAYAAWEAAHHPYVLRRVDPGSVSPFTGPDAGDATAFAGRRVLLFVHGVFSTCRSAFGDLPADVVSELADGYDATLAFDHPSVSVDPDANVAWLQERLRGADGATLDVIAHSRGGLVARAFAAAHPGQTVARVAFVGTPNDGTEIVDPRQWGALIDRFANLAADLPDDRAGELLAELFELLKAAAFAAVVTGFPGLECMLPGSDLLRRLAAAPAPVPEFFAVDTDFGPWGLLESVFSVRREFLDGLEVLVDRAVFDGAPNDVAVPTASVGLGADGAGFPVPDARSQTFGADEHVWHCSYFAQPRTQTLLETWLDGRSVG